MSLAKLFKMPGKLFKKEVISFLIIHRHDLGVLDDSLRYLAVRPSASISVLRQKIWHLLDLPDFCEEVILLKSDDVEIPLTELRKGNDPKHPFVLEVWLPPNGLSSAKIHNMLTMGNGDRISEVTSSDGCDQKAHLDSSEKDFCKLGHTTPAISAATMSMKKKDLSCRISSSTLFYKLQSRKSRDNFTNILLKIQNDLSLLSNKLSTLESKIPT